MASQVGGPSAADGKATVVPPTVLSAFQQFTAPEVLSSNSTHPFSSSPEELTATLRRIIETTDKATMSLNAHHSLPLSNPKLLSLYRQQSSISHTVQQADQNVRHVVSSLRKRIGITFGEDIPLERIEVVDWFLKRLLHWGTSAGMEAFNEQETDGRIAVVLGGKVLVIDIDFSIDRRDPTRPAIDVMALKTAYAIPNSTSDSSSGRSKSMEGFLASTIRAFLAEVQKEEDQRDAVEAARIGSQISKYLSYLMTLDHLALSENEGGGRWFSFIDKMSLEIETLAGKEANVIMKGEKGAVVAPLDVFLLRGHALPLPYLTTPSISFLTYVSPLAYLKLLKSSTPLPPHSEPLAAHQPALDVPFHHLRAVLATPPRQPGITVATLVLSPTPPPAYHAEGLSLSAIDARPLHALVGDAERVEYVFPAAREVAALQGQPLTWILDFTDGGKAAGLVVSQGRMREIELVHVEVNNMMGMSAGSWVDLLLNPQTPIPPERYTALYTSPTAAHPPLHLRLTSPDEPGFILESVPVRTLKEVWAVLEIVREQCWLNETLASCTWAPEGIAPHAPGPAPPSADVETDAAPATEDELQAVLRGTITPRHIPVAVSLPTVLKPAPQPEPSLFGDGDGGMDAFGAPAPRRAARISLRCPERAPITGIVDIGVTFDAARPRGVAVEIVGSAVATDVGAAALEEVCRRGGVFGVPARVWRRAKQGM
ncbi:uncharacterized protein BXZ73DRAFT_92575 [Epithele typhae]|uniref:uncharacterized protein n=1 Tax=Epithele typhae TaxID=378194 RepID=UPI002007A755|nr:uncharacterized protein BXZ73DRAFT_92575 [Epithele typhae]KAH9915799.1 hypothetical protein BXZ73DRAFT_92575 [Epithele typhae]